MTTQFPAEEFDHWAETYDESVANNRDFPFTGYNAVLEKVVELANPHPKENVLDLGIGTGNLALRFGAIGCEIWGIDFSTTMLEKARVKLPKAHLFQADLQTTWPEELNRNFDCIVSAYVFHHFQLDEKVQLINHLHQCHLTPGGKLIVADIAFENKAALETVKRISADSWEDEFYWLADETIPALAKAGLDAKFHRISSCAGVFIITG